MTQMCNTFSIHYVIQVQILNSIIQLQLFKFNFCRHISAHIIHLLFHHRLKSINIHPTGKRRESCSGSLEMEETRPHDAFWKSRSHLGGWTSEELLLRIGFILFALLESAESDCRPTDHRDKHVFASSLEPWRTGPSDLLTSTHTHTPDWEINVHAQTHCRCLIH